MSELRSRHAFGSISNVDAAIASGQVDAHDIIFFNEGKIGWVDKNGELVLPEFNNEEIVEVEALPDVGESGKLYIFESQGYLWNGKEFISLSQSVDVAALQTAISLKANQKDVETLERTCAKIKYEIGNLPEGALVDYGDKEIRILCPENTVWTKQSVGSTGNANMYYMSFKAYAPEGAVGFREGDKGVIVDEMFDFSGDFAGTDEFGRNYSIVWFALASYDEASDAWTYYGSNSSIAKYLGWTYVVEWYDAAGIVIASDSIRINLANKNCYSNVEPFYVANAISTANAYTDAQIEEKIEELAGVKVIEF